MKAIKQFAIAIIIVTSLVLSACAPTAPEAEPQVVEVIKTVEVEKEVEVVVTKEVEVKAEQPKMSLWVDHPFLVKSTEGLLKSYVLEWAQQNGVVIEYVQESDDVIYPRIDAAIESKTLPDVLLLNLAWLPKLQRAQITMDLSDLIAELNQNMGGFSEGSLAALTSPDGTQSGVPFLASSEMFYVRHDLLEAQGLAVPDSWEEVLKAAIAVNDPPNIWGWGQQVAEYDAERHTMSMIWSYGGSMLGGDGETITLDSEGTRAALQVIKDAWDAGIIPQDAVTWDGAGNNKAYQSGKAAIIENTGSVAAWLKANDPDLLANTTLKLFPAGPEGRFIQGDVWFLFIPNTTKYPDLAKDLVRYINQPALQEELITEMGGFRVPVYKGLADLAIWEDPTLKPLADGIPYIVMPGYPGPVSSTALEAFQQNVIAKMVLRILVDEWSIDEAIGEAVDVLERIQAQ